MVDTGSQSTVISCAMLHKIGKHMRSQGKDFPQLNRPHLHLYGKGGKDGTSQLNITAETLLTTNVALPLKLKFLKSNGDPLVTEMPKSTKTVKVSLIETTTIPARKGRFIEARLEQEFAANDKVIFEPNVNTLPSYGLSSMESILTVHANGNVLIPLQDFQQSFTSPEAGMELGTIERCEGQVSSLECKQGTFAQVSMLQQSEQKLAQSTNSQSTQSTDTQSKKGTHSTTTLTLTDRQAMLKLELKLGEQTQDCETKEVEQLEDLLLNSVDVFALNDSELG